MRGSVAACVVCLIVICAFSGWKAYYGEEQLLMAVSNRNVRTSRYLIGFGVNVNCESRNGLTPLHIAAGHYYKPKTKSLIPTSGPRGRGSLRSPSVELVHILLNSGARVNVRNNQGWTPLHAAGGYGDMAVVSILVRAGADPSMSDNDGTTTLDWALKNASNKHLGGKAQKNCKLVAEFLQNR